MRILATVYVPALGAFDRIVGVDGGLDRSCDGGNITDIR
jgi:hypothetical protein